MAIYTTEVTSTDRESESVIHHRLLSAYKLAKFLYKGNVLEIGCGNGRGLEQIIPHAVQVTAIDKNKELINMLAQDEKYKGIEFKCTTIPPLSVFDDNTFDTIVCFQLIEHLKNDSDFVKDLYRILKPGGKVILTTPNIKFTLTRNPWHHREYTSEQLLRLFSSSFKKPKINSYGVKGNDKVMEYYNENKRLIEKITRYDIFCLQHRLPVNMLKIPYELGNKLARNYLKKKNTGLVTRINCDDYYLSGNAEEGLDLFLVAEK
ncbi:MAG: class I SAM-dependent methyltransferase [Cytophagaceae bacterium]